MNILSIYDSSGNKLVQYPDSPLKDDESLNFQGVLSIIGPITKQDQTFLFTLTMGKHYVDVFYGFNRYVISVVPDNTISEIKNCNSFYAITAGCFFNDYIIRNSTNDQQKASIYDSFIELIPTNPLNSINSLINSLLSNEIEYVAFVTRGNRVIHSIGKPSEEPEDFIFSWCAALGAVDSLGEEQSARVDGYSKIFAFRMYDCINTICYTRHDVSLPIINQFADSANKVKTGISNLFQKTERFSPKLPDQPSSGGGRTHFQRF
ncbi:hypothetical protein TVAG_088750 [Trichomonas vaginalis G3]|uniref:Uncharacterized protein n=1 Tax=Trichomonas vaginalis (strain ATCC PRA-98 / G3) TaxID=412133 RepID=A2EB20_TRIV3|nr:hypothetical protein TVAGG3_0397890 [Trichomonas vaginalis G3]EAY10160.1 hypothetical protein TVAG_088750 [Trichomonas vaginalis G3]KAI5534465.1 hypothetical protein TVAGG3_0397890 [Trichomonas vaginalis G3]|eukprot:XP_001322383.1 hypothetical protein [Trichomonas vaginalis G3]